MRAMLAANGIPGTCCRYNSPMRVETLATPENSRIRRYTAWRDAIHGGLQRWVYFAAEELANTPKDM
jgi:hypothetical protein